MEPYDDGKLIICRTCGNYADNNVISGFIEEQEEQEEERTEEKIINEGIYFSALRSCLAAQTC